MILHVPCNFLNSGGPGSPGEILVGYPCPAFIAGPVSAGDQPLAVPRALCPIDTPAPLTSYSNPSPPARGPGEPYGNDPARARIIGQPVNGVQHRAEAGGIISEEPRRLVDRLLLVDDPKAHLVRPSRCRTSSAGR